MSIVFADDIFTTRQKPASESDAGRYIKPFTFQLQEAADRPYLFKEVGDRYSFEGLATVVGDLHLKRLDDEQALLDVYDRFLKTGDHRYAHLLQAKGIAVDVIGGSS